MFIRTRDSHSRSVAKALSWRIAGSLDTFVLSLIFTRSLQLAGSIAVTEMFTKWCFIIFTRGGCGLQFPSISGARGLRSLFFFTLEPS
jgi:hypothetical protein